MGSFFNIPDQHKNCTLTNYHPQSESQSAALRLVTKLAKEQPKKGLFMWGGYGTGKTHLAIALAKELRTNHPEEVFFFNLRDLYDIVYDQKSIAFKRPDWPANLDERVKRVPYLFLDEVFIKDHVGRANYLRDLVETRYNQGNHCMFMNSNISLEQQFNIRVYSGGGDENHHMTITSMYDHNLGGRTVSRIHQMCFVFELIGPDHRILQGRTDLEEFLKSA